MDFLAKQFAAVDRFDVKFGNDITLVDGSGKSATVTLTGQNVVRNREGGETTAAWQLTQSYRLQGNRWLITHDHFSTFSDGGVQVESLRGATAAAACRATASVKIEMPKLDLKMKTGAPVVWYSEVTTIPPVGFTASVSMTPSPLISEGREIGTLQSGIVKFREVVRHVPLAGTNWEQAGR